MDGGGNLFPFSRPREPGNHHIGPQGDADKESNDKRHQGHTAPYGCHGFLSHKLSHNDRIDGIEKLLHHARGSQKQGKLHGFACYGPMGHIHGAFHKNHLPL